MIRSRDTFALALAALRDAVGAGAFAPGTAIVIQDEARRLRLSTTPVREALAWLCGEGLVERAPLGGFVAPRLDAAILSHRYRFRLLCLKDALMRGGEWIVREGRADPVAIAVVFDHLAASVGDPELKGAFDRVQAHLDALRPVETAVLPEGEDETAMLTTGLDPAERALRVEAYHRRRIEAAPRLVLAASQTFGGVRE